MGSIPPLLNSSAIQRDPQIITGAVTLPQLPGSLHWSQSCTAFLQLPAEPMDHSWARVMLGFATGRDGQGTQCLALNSTGVLERCFISKTVPKSKASLPAAGQQRSSSAPVAITRLQKGREATGGKWAADREETTGSNCPGSHVSSCCSSSSWWSFKPLPIHLSLSKLKQQLLAVDHTNM